MLREHASRFRLAHLAALVGSAVFLLAGCEPAKEPLPSSFDTADVDTYCRDWAKLRNAGFVYENNVWNQGTIKREHRAQCLLKRVVDGKVQYGWRWQWPRAGGNVKAYPEVIYGHKPWFTDNSESAPSNIRYRRTIRYLRDAQRLEPRNYQKRASCPMSVEARRGWKSAIRLAVAMAACRRERKGISGSHLWT